VDQYHPDQSTRDTLRLSERQQRALLAYLDSQSNESLELDDQRIEHRFDFSSTPVLIRIGQPGGTSGTFIVRPRNLSRTGLGFLHGSFCYPGSHCEVVIPTSDAERAALTGRIVRCRHVRANVHEVGMQFDTPIEIGRFVQPTASSDEPQAAQASAQLPKLTGRCLLIDPSTDTRELFDFIAMHLGLTTASTLDGPSAKALIESQAYDVLLVDHDLASVVQPGLVGALKEAGFRGPILGLVLREPTEADQRAHQELGFDGVIVKPLNFERLLEGLSKHLSRDWRGQRNTAPLFSEHWSTKAMQPLILGHLERLEYRISDVHAALRDDDATRAGRVLREIAGAAGGFGFPQISKAAADLADVLESEGWATGWRQRFDELAELCAAACQVRKRRLG